MIGVNERLGALRDHPVVVAVRRVWDGRRIGPAVHSATAILALYAGLWFMLRHNRPPLGVFLYGGILGLLYAMVAFGLILVYRANRIINFATAEMGSASAVVAVLLMKSRFHLPYLPALVLALVAGGVTGLVVELVIVRRFARSPRLLLTVATIFVGLLFAALEFFMPQWITGRIVSPAPPKTPFSGIEIHTPGFIFDANALVVVVAVGLVMVGLSAFFRYTDVGLAVRASAENADRAALLGVPVKRVSTVVWVIAGALAALGVFLRAPVVGLPVGVLVGPQVLLFGLTAAVAGRMERFGPALVTAVGLGVLEQTLFYFSSNPNIASAVVLPVLLAIMLLQRGSLSRGEDSGVSTWSQAAEYRPIPPELRRLPEVQWGRFAMAAIVVVAPLAVTTGFTVFQQSIASVIVVYAIVGVSLVILTGWAGQISLGQWGFAGVGAAVASGLTVHIHADFFVALVVAGLVGAVAAVVIGLPAIRIQGLYLAVVTLAVAIAVQVYVLSPNYTGWLLPNRAVGIPRPILYQRFDLSGDRAFYFFSLIVLALAVLSARALRHSRTGRVLVAARDNPRGAQAYGVSVARARLTAFAISGFWASLAGALFAFHQGSIDTQAFSPQISLLMLSTVVIGGLTSIAGAVLGAVFIGWSRYYLSGQAQVLVSGLGVLGVLMFLRGGLAGVVQWARDGMLRWVAGRREMVVPSLVADRRIESEPEVETVDVFASATTDLQEAPA